MRKITRFLSILMLFVFSVQLGAQDYCMNAAIGWGTGVTGAGSGKNAVVVTTEKALRDAVKSNALVIVDGAITLAKAIEPNGVQNL
ncbi:MAG: hypothetical protein LBR75_06075, partial [Prevotellaceae bacterium]|nr:hypothetical protein [Prevotellaceae bacterium]